jgi:hypothetical protein
MKSNLLSALIIASPMFAAQSAYSEITNWKTVGEWDVSFYPGTGGCLASAEYEGGLSFLIGLTDVNGDIALEIVLLKEEWQAIEDDKEYTVNVKFGNETPWTLEMTGVRLETFNGLNFSISAATEEAGLIAEEFVREVSMDWTYDGKNIAFVTLRGSRAAFEEAVACTKSYRNATQQSDDPFSSSSQRSADDPFAN